MVPGIFIIIGGVVGYFLAKNLHKKRVTEAYFDNEKFEKLKNTKGFENFCNINNIVLDGLSQEDFKTKIGNKYISWITNNLKKSVFMAFAVGGIVMIVLLLLKR